MDSKISDDIAAAERYTDLADAALTYQENQGEEISPQVYAAMAQARAALGLLRVEAAGFQRRRNYPRRPSKLDEIK